MKIAVDVIAGEVRIRQPGSGRAATESRIRLTERHVSRRQIVRLRDIAPVQQVDGVGSDVVHFQRRIVAQLAFRRNCPRLHVRIERVLGFDDSDERQGGDREGSQCSIGREHLVAQFRQARINGRVLCQPDAVRVDIGGVVDLPALKRVEEDAVSPTNHCLVRQPVVQTEAGSKRCLQTGMRNRSAIAQHWISCRATGSDTIGRQLWIRVAKTAVRIFGIKPEEVVVRFIGCCAIIPAQTEAHS